MLFKLKKYFIYFFKTYNTNIYTNLWHTANKLFDGTGI
jgi:hypothetical protein